MSDFYSFVACPRCKKETDYVDQPELTGYVGDKVKCSNCKTLFLIDVRLVKISSPKRLGKLL